MNKEDYLKMGEDIKKSIKTTIKVTLIIMLVLIRIFIILPISVYPMYWCYIYLGETLLYTHETSQGYTVSVYEQGHGDLLQAKHDLIIKVNDEPIVKVVVIEDSSIYTGSIYCSWDTAVNYVLTFGDRGTIIFNPDFQSIWQGSVGEMELLSENIHVRKD